MIKRLHISEIRLNERNPRTIREVKFKALVRSLITFPKMILLREITVDKDNISIGGNMRYRVLVAILDMSVEEIREIINKSRKWRNRSKEEKDRLLEYWIKWKEAPYVDCKDGSDLDEYERKEFIAKDNESYGDTDWDLMSSEYDEEDLDDWGFDLWPDEDDEDDDEEDKKKNDGPEGKKLTFVLTEKAYDLVIEALKEYDDIPELALLLALGIKQR